MLLVRFLLLFDGSALRSVASDPFRIPESLCRVSGAFCTWKMLQFCAMREILFCCFLTLVCAIPILGSGLKPGGPPCSGAVSENSRKGIDEFNRRFIEACRSMDHRAAGELWADDGVDLIPGMEPMIGKAAISQWLSGLDEQMKGAKVTQCDVDWQQINVAGGVAYEWGINTQTVSIPDKPEPAKNKGKITLILRRQPEGDWKLALESWNSSPQK